MEHSYLTIKYSTSIKKFSILTIKSIIQTFQFTSHISKLENRLIHRRIQNLNPWPPISQGALDRKIKSRCRPNVRQTGDSKIVIDVSGSPRDRYPWDIGNQNGTLDTVESASNCAI